MNFYNIVVKLTVFVMAMVMLSLQPVVAADLINLQPWTGFKPVEKATVFSVHKTLFSDKRFPKVAIEIESKETQLNDRDECSSIIDHDTWWNLTGMNTEMHEIFVGLTGLELVNAKRNILHKTFNWPLKCLRTIKKKVKLADFVYLQVHDLVVFTSDGGFVLTGNPKKDGVNRFDKYQGGIKIYSPYTNDFVPIYR